MNDVAGILCDLVSPEDRFEGIAVRLPALVGVVRRSGTSVWNVGLERWVEEMSFGKN
ncbi:MAG: hypothetical protein L7W43_19370 [Rubripirellula sp.]|nr:hypothetical protein [Rubripirellula sp.]